MRKRTWGLVLTGILSLAVAAFFARTLFWPNNQIVPTPPLPRGDTAEKEKVEPIKIVATESQPMWGSVDTDLGQPELPEGWRLEDISKANSPAGVPSTSYVLAWKMTTNETRSHIDEVCLALSVPQFPDGTKEWLLAHLHRLANDKHDNKWELSMYHEFPDPSSKRGGWVWEFETFKRPPLNKDIYAFTDVHQTWTFRAERGNRIVASKVCTKTWESVIKEKPTRFFLKQQ